MAKQQRASSRTGESKPVNATVSPDSRPLHRATDAHTLDSASRPVPSRPEHADAVALYEEGVAALQSHQFARASALLQSVLTRFPEERALHERVRLYLNICERHTSPRAASPSTPDERVFAATLAINAGNYEEALEQLRAASLEAPEHDQALYMLASVLALRGQIEEAVPLLLRAIDLNPENRSLARHDADLGALREFHSVRMALEANAHQRTDARKAPRRR